MNTESPRSAEMPMAFTEREFMRGALWAWLAFLILLPLTLATSLLPLYIDPARAVGGFFVGLLIGVLALFLAAPIGLVMMVLGIWPLRLIGRVLQRVRSFAVHLLVYCAVGAAAGVGTGFVAGSWFTVFGGVTVGVATGAAIPLGWVITARRALRDDRIPPLPNVDIDAAFEDRALDH
ncbi:hypothetical protein [Microbacterium sp. NPDC057650]|uniref:hypothetical protein n=1 Tax=unclassified Microbacterium TaxID=2609290 RepID=UPI00366D93FC